MKCEICSKEINQLQGRNRKICNGCNTRLRRMQNKLRAIELLGGKCYDCGYCEHPAALEFHHANPDEKEFNVGKFCNRKWEIVEKEVLKCLLLCSNCHRIRHSTRYDDPKLKEYLKVRKLTR